MSKVLFDSQAWLNNNPADYIEEFLDITGSRKEDFRNEEELLEAVSDWLYTQSQYDWEDFLDQLKTEQGHCLVTGYFMSWMGPQKGGKVFKDLATAASNILLDDSHPVFSINKDGLLVLDETHHDAPCHGNHYEFRILTANGEKYYEKHCNDDRRSLCEALLERKRSRNIKLKTFYLSEKDFAEETQQ